MMVTRLFLSCTMHRPGSLFLILLYGCYGTVLDTGNPVTDSSQNVQIMRNECKNYYGMN
ncbi:MAG: hypothetical protein AB9879_02105 [Methanothrix sp.]